MIVTDDGGRQLAGPTHPHLADLGDEQSPAGPDRESIAGESERLPVIFARFESRPAHPPAPTFPGRRIEKVPARPDANR